MTEREFWYFLGQRGKVQILSGSMESESCDINAAGEYMRSHALLPKDYDNLLEEDIINMGQLLFQGGIMRKTKEAIIVLLAHQVSDTALTMLTKYNLMPDKGLEIFAEIALEECLMWNEGGRSE